MDQLQTKKTIIFDFDGTIADTLPHIFQIINRLAPEYGFEKLDKENLEETRGLTYQEIVFRFKIPLIKIPFLLLRGKQELNKEIGQIPLCSGMGKLIRQLKEKGYKLGILSSNSQENLDKFFQTHDLNVFEFVHSELNIFGKAQSLNNLIKKYNLNKEDTIYVGDEIRDIEACKWAGVKIISVTWGFNRREVLEKHKPDFLVNKASEILEII